MNDPSNISMQIIEPKESQNVSIVEKLSLVAIKIIPTGLWPSLMFADEDIELKIFGLHPKVMLPQPFYAFILWQHDFWMKQIFFSSIFSSENTGQLAKQAGYLGHNL
jgi:hypothetical protein